MKTLVLLASATVVAILAFGCSSTKVAHTVNPHSVVQSIDKGTNEHDAIKHMTENGFSCKKVVKGTFTSQTLQENGKVDEVLHADVDYIRCRRSDGGEIRDEFVTTVWTVALILDHESKVSDVYVWSEYIGL